MKKNSLFNGFLVVFGGFLIAYAGLYYCGWGAIANLIDYASCNWDCIENTDIAWAAFRLVILMEFFILTGAIMLIYGINRL